MSRTTLKKAVDFQVKQTINDAVYQVLSDPDFGATLRPEVIPKLERRSSERGKKVSLSTLRRKYPLIES